ncbi:MAG: glycoside hydrolase family 15 protein [Nitrospirota bacterium]
MPRDLAIGNGSLLVNFDGAYCVRDFYFPRVGRDNNTVGHPSRVGIWVNGRFSWFHDPGWERKMTYLPDTLVTDVHLSHRDLGLSLHCHDWVDSERTIFLRSIAVTNHWDHPRDVRLLFSQDFHIGETESGDTAYYEPVNDVLIHYKGKRYFLVNGRSEDGKGIYQYAIGTKENGGAEGTWRDAEDGELGMNPIAQGSVDSTVSLRQTIPAGETVRFRFWIAAEQGYFEVKELNTWVLQQDPASLLRSTETHWRIWVTKRPEELYDLSDRARELYRRSLLIIRTQIDNGGAILAANDGDSSMFNRDTYSYMWPRDGALVAHALDLAGHHDLTAKFFEFCAGLMPKPTYYPEGYLLHKYNPDGSLGSSWHPWIRGGVPKLPIQEDETALVLWALWSHYELSGDRAFAKSMYDRMIRPASKFMLTYRHGGTGLPLESYDLWEERYGVLTFTTAAVCAGLEAGTRFAALFGDAELEKQCAEGAQRMKAAALTHLYRPDLGRFARMITFTSGDEYSVDPTIDSSLYGVFAFGVLPADQAEVVDTMRAIEQRLWIQTEVGGVARYENDYYHQKSGDIGRVAGNPWPICTLWLALWFIETAKTRDDLRRPKDILEWVANHALPSGVLAEQLHPYSGEPVSISPLTWSHAAYVETALIYASRYRSFEAPKGRAKSGGRRKGKQP